MFKNTIAALIGGTIAILIGNWMYFGDTPKIIEIIQNPLVICTTNKG